MAVTWSELAPLATQSPVFDCALYPIEDQQLLSVIGPDSQKFMQGQFTCNLNDITPNQFRPGACCNAKGRMVTSFSLLQREEGHYLMSLDASLTDITLNHLKKYMVFFKTQMQPAQYLTLGIQGVDAGAALTSVFDQAPVNDYEQISAQDCIVVKLPHDAGFQLWFDPSQDPAAIQSLMSKCTLSSNTKWNENLIRHGLGRVSANTSEAFIPQMMNFAQAGGVSFSKGCYTGQEIVARMQYLGKLKRHMYRLGLDGQVDVQAGDEVYVTGQGNSVGTVINAVNCDGQQQALVVLEDKALEKLAQGIINVGPKQANAKELLSLPYDVIDAQPE
ncbi:MAG: folate-binding protein YgfZ [Bermanella sp.]|jgi:folate-binding protein YgfZ